VFNSKTLPASAVVRKS